MDRKRLKFKKDYTYLNRNMIMEEHPKHIYESLLSYFKQEDLHQYPDLWDTYDVLSKYLGVSEEQLLITRGVEGSVKCMYETILERGDTIGVLTPTWAMYHVFSKVYGIEEIHIKGTAPDYTITVEQIKKVIPKIKVLFLDNPKSQLPSNFNDDELHEILHFAQQHQVIVFFDEVYIGWNQKSYLPNLSNHKNLIISQSFSKIGFPSIKAGWLVTNKELKKRIELTRSSYELNYFGCKVIKFLIDNHYYVDDLKKRILDTKERWYKELSQSSKFKVYNSKTYVLRLYSEDKELIKKTYDNLYNKKIVVGLVNEVNLVFSVVNNKVIEDIIFKEVVGE